MNDDDYEFSAVIRFFGCQCDNNGFDSWMDVQFVLAGLCGFNLFFLVIFGRRFLYSLGFSIRNFRF